MATNIVSICSTQIRNLNWPVSVRFQDDWGSDGQICYEVCASLTWCFQSPKRQKKFDCVKSEASESEKSKIITQFEFLLLGQNKDVRCKKKSFHRKAESFHARLWNFFKCCAMTEVARDCDSRTCGLWPLSGIGRQLRAELRNEACQLPRTS
jgi:hypothetical protein